MRLLVASLLMLVFLNYGFAAYLPYQSQKQVEWIEYPAQTGKPIACQYKGYLWSSNLSLTNGLQYGDGRRFSQGAKTNSDTTLYVWPIERLSDDPLEAAGGLIAYTTVAPYLLYVSDADCTNNAVSFSDATIAAGVVGPGFALSPQSFIDCGKVNISGTDRRLLLFVKYADSGEEIFYSIDAGATWTEIGFTDTSDIRHFHSGIWLDGVGANEGTLLIFTGDSDAQSSILKCDDVDDLISNPATWETRWGLDDRSGWSGAPTPGGTPDSAYVVDWNSQRSRVVGMAYDGTYGYWIPDGYIEGYTHVHRLAIADWSITTLTSDGDVHGFGWGGHVLSNGAIILHSGTSFTDGSPTYAGDDAYAHVYCVLPNKADVVELAKTPRVDYSQIYGLNSGSSSGTLNYYYNNHVEHFGGLHFNLYGLSNSGNTMLGSTGLVGYVNLAGKVVYRQNLLTDGDFSATWSPVGADGRPNSTNWYSSGYNHATVDFVQSSFIPPVSITNDSTITKSMKWTLIDSDQEPYVSTTICSATKNPELLARLKGKYITARALFYYESATHGTTSDIKGQITFNITGGGGQIASNVEIDSGNLEYALVGRWIVADIVRYVPDSATDVALIVSLQRNTSAEQKSLVGYITGVAVYEGVYKQDKYKAAVGNYIIYGP